MSGFGLPDAGFESEEVNEGPLFYFWQFDLPEWESWTDAVWEEYEEFEEGRRDEGFVDDVGLTEDGWDSELWDFVEVLTDSLPFWGFWG